MKAYRINTPPISIVDLLGQARQAEQLAAGHILSDRAAYDSYTKVARDLRAQAELLRAERRAVTLQVEMTGALERSARAADEDYHKVLPFDRTRAVEA